MLRVILAGLMALLTFLPSLAQPSREGSSVATILAELKGKSPKCVIVLLDVSESMKVEGLNRKMHQAVEQLFTEGLEEGDRAVLYVFGSGYRQVFDALPATPAARRKLIEQVPLRPEPGAGTNIRQPHHEALKLARASGKLPFIVIVTDSFNDPPKDTPTAYAEYQKYYTPGKLETYPKTPENREYESLLAWMGASGGKTFGLGVEIQPNQRPKEHFKVALQEATPATPEPQATPAPTRVSASKNESLPLGLIGALVAVLAGGGAFAYLKPRPMPLRITGGPSGARDFDVRGNTVLRLGGEGGAGALDAYPLAATKEVVATVRASRGQLTLQPQPKGSTRVTHNGLPLEKPTALRFGDEIRVTVLDPSGAVIKENRLKISDPTKTF